MGSSWTFCCARSGCSCVFTDVSGEGLHFFTRHSLHWLKYAWTNDDKCILHAIDRASVIVCRILPRWSQKFWFVSGDYSVARFNCWSKVSLLMIYEPIVWLTISKGLSGTIRSDRTIEPLAVMHYQPPFTSSIIKNMIDRYLMVMFSMNRHQLTIKQHEWTINHH